MISPVIYAKIDSAFTPIFCGIPSTTDLRKLTHLFGLRNLRLRLSYDTSIDEYWADEAGFIFYNYEDEDGRAVCL